MDEDGAWSLGPPHPTGQSLLAAHGVACPTLAGGRVPTLDDLVFPRLALTAGGRGDGAVQVGQATGGRVHTHRHGEAEDELGGGRGRGLAPLPQGPRRAGRLRRARRRGGGGGGEHLGFELQQLPHEAEVGRDDAPALLDELEGFLQPHAFLHHQVGQADGG